MVVKRENAMLRRIGKNMENMLRDNELPGRTVKFLPPTDRFELSRYEVKIPCGKLPGPSRVTLEFSGEYAPASVVTMTVEYALKTGEISSENSSQT